MWLRSDIKPSGQCKHRTFRIIPPAGPRCALIKTYYLKSLMFVNGEGLITSQLEKINLNVDSKYSTKLLLFWTINQWFVLTVKNRVEKSFHDYINSSVNQKSRPKISIVFLMTYNLWMSFVFSGNMQPKSDRPPVAATGQVPQLHLTPSGGGQKRVDGSPQSGNNPWLLKPQHEIPPTPPPQTNPQPLEFFPQRIG